MGTAIFGPDVTAKLFVPKSSAEWSIGEIFKKGDYDNVILSSFDLMDVEIVDVRRCFEETTHIFAFGRHPEASLLTVSVMIFLDNGCEKEYSKWLKLDKLREEYKKNRVYEKKTPSKVSIDDLVLNGFLIKMAISDVNPMTKTCIATFTFLLDQEV